jgi:hypothetical protein
MVRSQKQIATSEPVDSKKSEREKDENFTGKKVIAAVSACFVSCSYTFAGEPSTGLSSDQIRILKE